METIIDVKKKCANKPIMGCDDQDEIYMQTNTVDTICKECDIQFGFELKQNEKQSICAKCSNIANLIKLQCDHDLCILCFQQQYSYKHVIQDDHRIKLYDKILELLDNHYHPDEDVDEQVWQQQGELQSKDKVYQCVSRQRDILEDILEQKLSDKCKICKRKLQQPWSKKSVKQQSDIGVAILKNSELDETPLEVILKKTKKE